MKKMIFSAAAFALVAVSSIALAPTTASAIPAFARQTGAACYSCHFQTFPAINAFGRAFKMGSFTDVGDQSLIEDDNLSIPAVLNATFVVKANVENVNKTGLPSTTVYNVPTDTVLMIAGRIGSNSGAFIEFAGGAEGAANWQLLNSWDVSGFKVGLGAHKSGFGGSGVLELSNVFGQHGGVLGGKGISAIQTAGFAQDTTGIGAWIGNDLGVVQFALLAPAGATAGTVNVGSSFAKLVRVIATLDVGGWDTLIGFGFVTGNAGKGGNVIGMNSGTPTPPATVGFVAGNSTRVPMNLQFVDVQLQGDVGDIMVGIYGDWAHAKGKDGLGGVDPVTGLVVGTGNFYGGAAGSDKFDAFSIRTTVELIPRVTALIGYGYDKSTRLLGDVTHKQFQIGAQYALYQNMELKIIYNSNKLTDAQTPAFNGTTSTTTFEVEALM